MSHYCAKMASERRPPSLRPCRRDTSSTLLVLLRLNKKNYDLSSCCQITASDRASVKKKSKVGSLPWQIKGRVANQDPTPLQGLSRWAIQNCWHYVFIRPFVSGPSVSFLWFPASSSSWRISSNLAWFCTVGLLSFFSHTFPYLPREIIDSRFQYLRLLQQLSTVALQLSHHFQFIGVCSKAYYSTSYHNFIYLVL